MNYRPPTYQEIDTRVRRVRFWIALGLYVAIGLGGGVLFSHFIRDPVWVETFASVWWLPSGLAALWLTWWATHWIVKWVPEEPQQPL